MLVLLLGMISVEAGVILTPARKVVMVSLDRMKRGRSPIIVKSVAATLLAVLASSANNFVQIQRRMSDEHGDNTTPTDQVLMANYLLQASLMGFFLFLALLTDRLHHYMRELRRRRKSTMEAVRKNDGKYGGVEEILAREEQVGTFRDIVRQFESELEDKTVDLVASEAKIDIFKKQYDGLILDYERLISKNQEFRGCLHSLDRLLPNPPPAIDKTDS